MRVSTRGSNFFKARATASADGSFPSRVPTLTTPADDGVVTLGDGPSVPGAVVIVPFGTGADDSTFDMRLIGWHVVGSLWIPTLLAQFAVTLSTAVGVSGGDLTGSDRLADTLSLTAGNANVDVVLLSPTSNLIAHAKIDTKGCKKVEFTFDLGTATGANCLYAAL